MEIVILDETDTSAILPPVSLKYEKGTDFDDGHFFNERIARKAEIENFNVIPYLNEIDSFLKEHGNKIKTYFLYCKRFMSLTVIYVNGEICKLSFSTYYTYETEDLFDRLEIFGQVINELEDIPFSKNTHIRIFNENKEELTEEMKKELKNWSNYNKNWTVK